MAHIFVDGETLTAKQLNDNFTEIRNNTNTRLTALEVKTGWTTIDPMHISAGFRANSNLEYSVVNGTVYLQGKLQRAAGLAINDYFDVFRLMPASIRPLRDIHEPLSLRAPLGTVPRHSAGGAIQIQSSDGWARLYVSQTGYEAAFINLSWPL